MLYSCSWPAYQVFENQRPNYALIAKHCNLWRNYDDIENSFASIMGIMEFYAKNQEEFAQYHGIYYCCPHRSIDRLADRPTGWLAG